MDELFARNFKATSVQEESPEPTGHSVSWKPLMDVYESADSWVLIVDLPGVAHRDLEVKLTENRLIMSGERGTTPVLADMKANQIERFRGNFSLTFEVPDNTSEEAVQAELKDGVLTVIIAKKTGSPVTHQRIPVIAG
jgi:HSP20 family protein